MSHIVMQFWNRQWQTVKFDVEKGCGNVRWFANTKIPLNGWAYRHKGKWYCLWNDHDSGLVFQVEVNKWPLGRDFRFFNEMSKNGDTRLFRIEKGSSIVSEIEYRAVGKRWWNRLDITFDEADEEQTDFFLWVSRVAADQAWQKNMIRNWSG